MEKKKNILCISICVALFVAGFLTGRYIRFRVLQSDSRGIESTISEISNGLSDAKSSISDGIILLNGTIEFGQLANIGISAASIINEKQRILINELKREIENSIAISEGFKSAYSELSNSTEYALELAIRDAEEYERLIGNLQRIIASDAENINSEQ